MSSDEEETEYRSGRDTTRTGQGKGKGKGRVNYVEACSNDVYMGASSVGSEGEEISSGQEQNSVCPGQLSLEDEPLQDEPLDLSLFPDLGDIEEYLDFRNIEPSIQEDLSLFSISDLNEIENSLAYHVQSC